MDEIERKVREILVDQIGADLRLSSRPMGKVERAFADFCLQAKLGDVSHRLCFELKSGPLRDIERLSLKAREIRSQNRRHIYLLVVPHLSERGKRLLQSYGVNYLDFAGDVWIRAPGLYVKADARHGKRVGPRKRSRGNPFSKKASLIARILLHQPGRFWGIREMSEESGLSVGYTSEVMREMETRGYSERKRSGDRLRDPVLLLRDWTESYSWTDNDVYSFVVPADKEEVARAIIARLSGPSRNYAFTLLSAADFVIPHVSHDQMQAYVVESLLPEITTFIQGEMSAEPVASGGNCHLLVPYYGKATFYGGQSVAGASVVSNEQLFLDLVHYPVRGVEAADVLVRTALSQQLGLSSGQVNALREWLTA